MFIGSRINICWWESNLGPLVSEPTALPIEPQPEQIERNRCDDFLRSKSTLSFLIELQEQGKFNKMDY